MKNLHNEVSKHGIPELMFLKRFFKNKTERGKKKTANCNSFWTSQRTDECKRILAWTGRGLFPIRRGKMAFARLYDGL